MVAQVAPSSAALPASGKGLSTKVFYTAKPQEGHEPLSFYITEPPAGKPRRNFTDEQVEVTVCDIRGLEQKPKLHVNGFELVPFAVPDDIDWTNKQDVEARYYPLVEQMLKKQTGAQRVFLFDHTLRRGLLSGTSEDMDKAREIDGGFRKPVPTTHVDYDRVSGPKRLNQLLPQEAEELKKRPYAIIQAWHCIGAPIQDSPLGFVDAQTCTPDDFQPLALHLPERVGRVQAVTPSPQQRWFYTSNMAKGEAYVWTGYDSRPEHPCFVPHSSFKDPTAPANPPLRESVEARAYCFF